MLQQVRLQRVTTGAVTTCYNRCDYNVLQQVRLQRVTTGAVTTCNRTRGSGTPGKQAWTDPNGPESQAKQHPIITATRVMVFHLNCLFTLFFLSCRNGPFFISAGGTLVWGQVNLGHVLLPGVRRERAWQIPDPFCLAMRHCVSCAKDPLSFAPCDCRGIPQLCSAIFSQNQFKPAFVFVCAMQFGAACLVLYGVPGLLSWSCTPLTLHRCQPLVPRS